MLKSNALTPTPLEMANQRDWRDFIPSASLQALPSQGQPQFGYTSRPSAWSDFLQGFPTRR